MSLSPSFNTTIFSSLAFFNGAYLTKIEADGLYLPLSTLNTLSPLIGITAGAAQASKALVLDGSKNITGIQGLCLGSSTDTSRYLSLLVNASAGTTLYSMTYGVDNSPNNQSEFAFYYNGNGSTGNALSFGFYGNSNILRVSADQSVDIPFHNGTTGLKLGGTLITATAAEINFLDITAAGTGQANKALILDGSRNISNINRITATGNVSLGNTNNTYRLDCTGTAIIDSLKIRATGSLNYDTPNYTIRARNGSGFDSGLQIAPDAQGLLNVSNIGFWTPNFTTLTMYLSSSAGQACLHTRPQAADVSTAISDMGFCSGNNAVFRDGVIISSMPLSNSNNYTPQTKLRVIGDNNYLDGTYQKVAEFCNSLYTNTLAIECSTTAGNPVFLGTTTNCQLRFGTNNATQMTINGGYVGIGTTTPRCPLEVSGSQLVGLNIDMLNTVYRKRTDNTSTIAETSTGTVSYNFSLWCSEYIYSKAIVMVSDRRMKTDIVNMDFKRVEKFYEVMEPKTYKFKSNLTRTEHGLIAQDVVKEGFLDLISMMPNEELEEEGDEADVKGYQLGIDYQKITMFNMRMIKKMKDEIKELKAIVETLTSKPALAKWMTKSMS